MSTAQISTVIQPIAPRGEISQPSLSSIFTISENVHSMQLHLPGWEICSATEYELVIGGDVRAPRAKSKSLNPSRPAPGGGRAPAGRARKHANAHAGLPWMRSRRAICRSRRARGAALQTAELIRKRKFEFCAWLTYEVGKNWIEADADVAETIDFLEFYAREALRLAKATTPIQYPGNTINCVYTMGVSP